MNDQKSDVCKQRQRGWSLIEALMVLGILGVILVIAIPNFRQGRIRANIISQMKQVRQAAAVARINAIKSGRQTAVTTGDIGLIAWVDENADGVLDATERVLGRWHFGDNITVTATNTLALIDGASARGVVFMPNGMANSSPAGIGVGVGDFNVQDLFGNLFRVRIRGGSGTVEEEMWDPDRSDYYPEPYSYWRY